MIKSSFKIFGYIPKKITSNISITPIREFKNIRNNIISGTVINKKQQHNVLNSGGSNFSNIHSKKQFALDKFRFYTTTTNNNNEGGGTNNGTDDYQIKVFNQLKQFEHSLGLVNLYPKMQHVYYTLFSSMKDLEIQVAELNDGVTKLTQKEVLLKELDNTPIDDKGSRNRILSLLFLQLNLYVKETVIINGKSYNGIELALLILDNDETNPMILDFIDDHLYVTGESTIKLLNGKDLSVVSKFGNLKIIEGDKESLIKLRLNINDHIQAVEYYVSKKDYDSNLLLGHYRMLINSMHKYEKVLIFGMEMDKLEIVSKLIKDHPTLSFGYYSIADIMFERNKFTLVPGGKEFDIKELLIMDLENIHSNLPKLKNQLSDVNGNEIFLGMYMYLLDKITTLMKGFQTTIQIAGHTYSKLDLILTMWEIKNSQKVHDDQLDNVSNLVATYLHQTGQTFLPLKNGKILNFDYTCHKFFITNNEN